MLISWLALGVIVIGLLNLAKAFIRSSKHPTRNTITSATTPFASGAVDGAQRVGSSFGHAPPSQSGAAVLPPPAARRSL